MLSLHLTFLVFLSPSKEREGWGGEGGRIEEWMDVVRDEEEEEEEKEEEEEHFNHKQG